MPIRRRPSSPAAPAPRVHGGSFDDSLAIVTGAASGIGAETAHALAARGARVVLLDIDHEAAEREAANINAGGGWAKARLADVADREGLERLAAELVEAYGPIDIVVNNAGVGMSGRFADMEAQDWEWIRSINLDGVINGCAVFGTPMLRAGAGHVVNVSSGLAYTMRATEPAYVTTKAAVLAFSRCLRADWAPQGVGVSVICPGIIRTPIFERSRLLGDQGGEKARRKGAKLFRRGHAPGKVAEAICRAIERDKGVVPVGWEARLGWAGNRFVPGALEGPMARVSVM